MFDLDREVEAWSQRTATRRCRRTPTADELKDHLYCEIERLEKDGAPREQAFTEASARLGRAIDLEGPDRSARGPLLANAFLWAALILATALVLARRDGGDSLAFLLITVFVPLWFASDLLLRRTLGLHRRR